jgi:hypothetical protein
MVIIIVQVLMKNSCLWDAFKESANDIQARHQGVTTPRGVLRESSGMVINEYYGQGVKVERFSTNTASSSYSERKLVSKMATVPIHQARRDLPQALILQYNSTFKHVAPLAITTTIQHRTQCIHM